MDRGAWQATVHGAAKESDRTTWLTVTLNNCELDRRSVCARFRLLSVWLVGFGQSCKQCSKFPRRTGSDDDLTLVMNRCHFQGRRSWQGGSEENHGVTWNCLCAPCTVSEWLWGSGSAVCVCVCVQKSTRTSRYQSLSFPHTLRMARERFVSCKPSVQNVFSNQHLLECLFNVLKH